MSAFTRDYVPTTPVDVEVARSHNRTSLVCMFVMCLALGVAWAWPTDNVSHNLRRAQHSMDVFCGRQGLHAHTWLGVDTNGEANVYGRCDK